MVKLTYTNLAAALLLLFGSFQIAFAQEKIESVYTELASSKCKTLTIDRETGASSQRCPGIAGYKLLVHDDDARQSITVITPDGKKHDLNFWDVVTHGFSSVGNKAEWRVVRNKRKLAPIALIVRVNASEDAANPNRKTSYLTVTKLTAEKICVTHKIAQSGDANAKARQAADEVRTAVCLKDAAP